MAIQIRNAGQTKEIYAVREFPDREKPRRAFWNRYEKMLREGSMILAYYGTGGVGKSRLLKNLVGEMEEGNKAYFSTHYKYILYDFATECRNPKDARAILRDLKKKLSAYGCEFPLFEAGDFCCSVLMEDGIGEEEIKSLIDEMPTLCKMRDALKAAKHLPDGMEAAASLLDCGEEMQEAMPGLGMAAKHLGLSGRETRKRLDEPHAAIRRQMDDRIRDRQNPNRLYEYLPMLFAQDVRDWGDCRQEKLVIFLDAYELIEDAADAAGRNRSCDLWLRNEGKTGDASPGLVFLIPRVLWVIAGRNKLRWGEKLEADMEQFLIETLSRDDADSFLQAAGVASRNLRDGIIRRMGGLPVYLDACAAIYTSCTRRDGTEPDISAFGADGGDAVKRMIGCMDVKTQGMIRALCALRTWTDKMAFQIVPNFTPEVYQRTKKLFFVQQTTVEEADAQETAFMLDRTVQDILFAECQKNSAPLLRNILARTGHYFSDLLKKTEPKDRAFSRCLERWADCIVHLTDDAEEILARYEEDLAPPIKAMGWNGFDTKRGIVSLFFDRVAAIGHPETVPYAFFEYQLGKAMRNWDKYWIAYEHIRSAYEKFVRLLGDEAEYSIKSLQSLAKVADYAGYNKESLGFFEKLASVCKGILGAQDEEMPEFMLPVAYQLRKLKRYEDALKLYEKIWDALKATHDEKDRKVLNVMEYVADTLKEMNRNEEALAIQKQVVAVWQERLDTCLKDTDKLDESSLDEACEIVTKIENVCLAMPESGSEDGLQQCLALQRHIIAVHKQVLGPEHEKTVKAMIHLVELLDLRTSDKDMMKEMMDIWWDVISIQRNLAGGEDDRTLEVMEEALAWAGGANLEDEVSKLYETMLPIKRRIAAHNREVFGEEDDRTIESMKEVAFCLGALERKEDKLKIMKEILSIRRKTFAPSHEKCIEAMEGIDISLCYMGRYEDALKLNEEILALRRASCEETDERTIQAMRDVALLMRILKRYEDAEKIYEEVLHLRRRSMDEDEEGVMRAFGDLSDCLNDMGQYERELSLYQEWLAFCLKKNGKDDEKTTEAMRRVANMLVFLHRYEEALAMWQQIVEIRQKKYGALHPEIAEALGRMSVCVALEIMSRYDEPWKSSLHEQAMHCSDNAKTILGLLRELADALKNAGHDEDAEKCFRQALDFSRAAFGEEDGRTVSLAAALGEEDVPGGSP